MRSSAEIREELLSGIEKKDLEILHNEARVLKNYGVLLFDDYTKLRGEIISERKLRKQREEVLCTGECLDECRCLVDYEEYDDPSDNVFE